MYLGPSLLGLKTVFKILNIEPNLNHTAGTVALVVNNNNQYYFQE